MACILAGTGSEPEPTESVTQGAWIRFGAGTSPDVAFRPLIGTGLGTCLFILGGVQSLSFIFWTYILDISLWVVGI